MCWTPMLSNAPLQNLLPGNSVAVGTRTWRKLRPLRPLRPSQGFTKCNTKYHSVYSQCGIAPRHLARSPQCDIVSHLLRWRISVAILHPFEVQV